jgi:hypothetical protein
MKREQRIVSGRKEKKNEGYDKRGRRKQTKKK